MQKVHTRCADIRNISENHYNLSNIELILNNKIELILNKANVYSFSLFPRTLAQYILYFSLQNYNFFLIYARV